MELVKYKMLDATFSALFASPLVREAFRLPPNYINGTRGSHKLQKFCLTLDPKQFLIFFYLQKSFKRSSTLSYSFKCSVLKLPSIVECWKRPLYQIRHGYSCHKGKFKPSKTWTYKGFKGYFQTILMVIFSSPESSRGVLAFINCHHLSGFNSFGVPEFKFAMGCFSFKHDLASTSSSSLLSLKTFYLYMAGGTFGGCRHRP